MGKGMGRIEPLSSPARFSALLVCAVSLASFVLQYVLLVRLTLDTVGPAFATVRFLSYFTILSNLAVICATASAALDAHGRFAAFWLRPRALGAIALYIGVTGTVYVTVLRHLWQPTGAQWWADSGLHYATPALYLGWWLLCIPRGRLAWRDVPAWLVFPAVYLAWALFRGTWAHEYPYPFIDVAALGAAAVARNALVVMALFVAFAAALVLLDRVLPPGPPRRALA